MTRGTRLAVLSKNRPEVLTNLTASLVNGCVVTPLHPMGSLADHAYVIGDAEIECLVFDADNFTERARELKAQYPDLTLLGFGPNDVGDDYLALADEFEPAPLDAPDVGPEDLCTIVYTGGTTGRPKGVLMSHRVWQAMTWIQMAEWEFPDELRIAIATPLSHAAMSLVAPVLLSGGAFYVMESFTPDGFFDLVAEHRITATLIVPVMLYALQGHPRYDDGRHVVDGDHLLRRVTDEPGQARPGDRGLGSDLLPVLRADRGADGHHPPEEGRARSRPVPTASPRAADRCRGCTSPCSTRRQPTRGARASRARSAPEVRW